MAKKLVWDNTDADTIAASDFVGAVLHAGSTELTTTLEGAKQALDVYVANSLTMDADGVYDGGSNTDPDNVGLIGHTRAASPTDVEQVERVTVGAASSDDVVAANVHGLDVNAFGMVYDGATWDRLLGTGGAVHIHDGGNSITVDGSVTVTATQLDIDDLNATDDAVQAWAFDGAGTAIGSVSDHLHVSASADGGVVASAVATSQVEAALPTAANRMYLDLYNHGSHEVYLGATGVSVASGFPIFPGVYRMYEAGPAIALYGINKAGKTSDLRCLELTA